MALVSSPKSNKSGGGQQGVQSQSPSMPEIGRSPAASSPNNSSLSNPTLTTSRSPTSSGLKPSYTISVSPMSWNPRASPLKLRHSELEQKQLARSPANLTPKSKPSTHTQVLLSPSMLVKDSSGSPRTTGMTSTNLQLSHVIPNPSLRPNYVQTPTQQTVRSDGSTSELEAIDQKSGNPEQLQEKFVPSTSPNPVYKTITTVIRSSNAFGSRVYGYIEVLKENRELNMLYLVDRELVSIGRDHRCNIRLSNLRVSRHQCNITLSGDCIENTKAFITHLTQRPTTSLNGVLLKPQLKTQLAEGDVIRIHEKEFRWRDFDPSLAALRTTPIIRLNSGADLPPTSFKKPDAVASPATPSKAKTRRRSCEQELRKAVLQKSFRQSVIQAEKDNRDDGDASNELEEISEEKLEEHSDLIKFPADTPETSHDNDSMIANIGSSSEVNFQTKFGLNNDFLKAPAVQESYKPKAMESTFADDLASSSEDSDEIIDEVAKIESEVPQDNSFSSQIDLNNWETQKICESEDLVSSPLNKDEVKPTTILENDGQASDSESNSELENDETEPIVIPEFITTEKPAETVQSAAPAEIVPADTPETSHDSMIANIGSSSEVNFQTKFELNNDFLKAPAVQESYKPKAMESAFADDLASSSEDSDEIIDEVAKIESEVPQDNSFSSQIDLNNWETQRICESEGLVSSPLNKDEEKPTTILENDGQASDSESNSELENDETEPIVIPEFITTEKPAETVQSAAPAEIVESAAPTETVESAAPAETVESAAPTETVESAAPAETVESAAPTETVESAAPAEIVESAAPAEIVESAAPAEIVESAAPAETVESTAPAETVESAAPEETVQSAEPTLVLAPEKRLSELQIVLKRLKVTEVDGSEKLKRKKPSKQKKVKQETKSRRGKPQRNQKVEIPNDSMKVELPGPSSKATTKSTRAGTKAQGSGKHISSEPEDENLPPRKRAKTDAAGKKKPTSSSDTATTTDQPSAAEEGQTRNLRNRRNKKKSTTTTSSSPTTGNRQIQVVPGPSSKATTKSTRAGTKAQGSGKHISSEPEDENLPPRKRAKTDAAGKKKPTSSSDAATTTDQPSAAEEGQTRNLRNRRNKKKSTTTTSSSPTTGNRQIQVVTVSRRRSGLRNRIARTVRD